MKTKFVLHGGFDPKKSLENDAFFVESLKDAPESAKVLIVLFAKDKGRWEEKYVHWKKQFQKNAGGKNLDFQMATLENFVEQLASADVVYFAGGRTETILGALKGFTGLDKNLNGKIVAADSAGNNALSRFCYSPILRNRLHFHIRPLLSLQSCHQSPVCRNMGLRQNPRLSSP
jgi:peptidase E